MEGILTVDHWEFPADWRENEHTLCIVNGWLLRPAPQAWYRNTLIIRSSYAVHESSNHRVHGDALWTIWRLLNEQMKKVISSPSPQVEVSCIKTWLRATGASQWTPSTADWLPLGQCLLYNCHNAATVKSLHKTMCVLQVGQSHSLVWWCYTGTR